MPLKTNEDLYLKTKQNIFGGPSIVFTRYMEKGQLLKDSQTEVCKNIVGYDANSLYPYSLSQEMPCGSFVRRRKERNFRPELQHKFLNMFIWMDRISEERNIQIQHKLNSGKEHYIRGFYIDGIYRNQIFEFNSCYYHGCPKCFEKQQTKKPESWKNLQKARLKRTLLRKKYLKSLGYLVEDIWECDFNRIFRNCTQHIRNKYVPKFYQSHKTDVSERTILTAIKKGELFGMVELDISVPESWNDHFKKDEKPAEFFNEFPPLFCTCDVNMDSIGEHMRDHLKKFQLSLRSRRLLVSWMKAKKK